MTTDCPVCGASTVSGSIPGDLREYAPGDAPAMSVCSVCLSARPLDDPSELPSNDPDEPTEDSEVPTRLGAISPDFPDDPETAMALALILATIDSISLYRAEITALVEQLERAGVDPFLTLDRLARDPDLDPVMDLRRRARQLEQLIE